MSVNEMTGWEFLYNRIEENLRTKTDILVAVTHFYLRMRADFQCVGIGEPLPGDKEKKGSGFLPPNWNANGTLYSLKYVLHGRLYILLGAVEGDVLSLTLNPLPGDKEKRGCCYLPPNWNANGTLYSLKYVLHGRIYILLGAVEGDVLSLTLNENESDFKKTISFNATNTVERMQGDLEELIPRIDDVVRELRKLAKSFISPPPYRSYTSGEEAINSANNSNFIAVKTMDSIVLQFCQQHFLSKLSKFLNFDYFFKELMH
ncbi:uncharacterized protein LOC116342323 isoform X2 [Contarinia nasturtii]|uniref:uncharacterized protein LOC116342323 isoform X2 n=1 Tax=Contarinia nasturtii TaxID=265458 RepID=UPI0012D46445|nr:uncharacterized protein LOC116342323 isoform X2 [Contarinia nasturtii]